MYDNNIYVDTGVGEWFEDQIESDIQPDIDDILTRASSLLRSMWMVCVYFSLFNHLCCPLQSCSSGENWQCKNGWECANWKSQICSPRAHFSGVNTVSGLAKSHCSVLKHKRHKLRFLFPDHQSKCQLHRSKLIFYHDLNSLDSSTCAGSYSVQFDISIDWKCDFHWHDWSRWN